MYKRFSGAGLLLCLMALAAPVHAIPISGEVTTRGGISTNTGDLGTATHLYVTSAWTLGGTGSYSPVNGHSRPVVYKDFAFSPTLVGPVAPLWTFHYGSHTYSFVLDSLSVLSQATSGLELFGTGTLYITGFDPTPGTWEFSAWRRTSRFKFSADIAETTSVPEPGTLALLGLGLLGVGVGRRRKS